VFFAEIINTAMEKSLDLISQENNHLVQQTKDMMAAAVLVTAIGSLVVAAAVFAPYIWELIILLKK
jgi:diacylglycerol kinase